MKPIDWDRIKFVYFGDYHGKLTAAQEEWWIKMLPYYFIKDLSEYDQ